MFSLYSNDLLKYKNCVIKTCFQRGFEFKTSFVKRNFIKGATKSYFTRYSCVVFVFVNTALCRSAFSTVSFRKLVFRLSVLSLNQDIKISIIMLCNFDM